MSIEQVIRRFEQVLSRKSEEGIQSYLTKHPVLMHPETVNPLALVPKMRLGELFVTDFVHIQNTPNAPLPLATLVELETATTPLFTAKGDQSARLTHAIRQVQDWQSWIEAHPDYFREALLRSLERSVFPPQGVQPRQMEQLRTRLGRRIAGVRYLIVMGRESQLTDETRARLARTNRDMHSIKIETYDMLVARVRAHIDWVVRLLGPTAVAPA